MADADASTSLLTTLLMCISNVGGVVAGFMCTLFMADQTVRFRLNPKLNPNLTLMLGSLLI